jgi:NADH:ubiquinone oxidoreductase subunit 5 (subunit L)/multisubunit Na+/H+ antiporter MnhA subunit
MERLGGLMKPMPRTGVLMLLGAVAIAGLPPLNGFVSEWFVYLGLMGSEAGRPGLVNIAALLGTGLLAFIGGLAALCFVRLIGAVLLGEPRSESAHHAHEASWGMLGPMAALAVLVVAMGIFPGVLLRLFTPVASQLFGDLVGRRMALAQDSVMVLGALNAALWVGLGMAALVWVLLRRPVAAPVGTWDCGYVAPTKRMQYSARSFSEFVTVRLFPRSLRPRTQHEIQPGPFPAPGSFSSQCPDPLVDRVYEPFFLRWADRFSRLRWIQQGQLHIYLLYIFVVAVAALAWITWRDWLPL